MTVPILDVAHVDKRFKGVQAVRDVSFAVRRGEIFALLGPNGAGKTTLVRMILGIIRPDAGAVTFRLHDGPAPPTPRELGYLPEDRGLYKDIPVIRTLVYFGMLRGMTRAEARKAAEAWLARMDLAPRARDKLDSLSKGNQQKVQFIASILHRPAFAVLDEPFSGLDPLNQDFFLDLIRELRDGGMTVLLSAHQMALVERLADRVFLMNHGREVRCGTLAELRDTVSLGTKIGFRYRAGDPSPLESHPSVQAVRADGPGYVEVEVRKGEPLGDLLAAAGRALEIVEVQSRPPGLHDIYVRALQEAGVSLSESDINGGAS